MKDFNGDYIAIFTSFEESSSQASRNFNLDVRSVENKSCFFITYPILSTLYEVVFWGIARDFLGKEMLVAQGAETSPGD